MFVKSETWLRCRAPRPRAAVRLVCLPHAGGSASFFHGWGALPAEVLAVQYPGRADRIGDPCAASVAELARAVADAVPKDKPFVLFGHSLGAIAAFEAARVLEHRHGTPPAHLIVSGRQAPDGRENGRVHQLPDAELVGEVVRLGGTDGALLAEPEARSVFLPPIRADFRIAETYAYRPGPVPSCPITAVLGSADSEVTPEQALRWARFTSGPFARHVLPGGHFYLVSEVDAVLSIVAATLEMRDLENV
ncbi:thioesterase [Lentzea flava]|uniref:Thioesterase n=1 Tax=Lentzea flava TaxID=103732 RepID=A0ABQ2UD15_9PSEU|nr:alpha/beta fold hydrolase [Lentzea flava]MCP2197850.1 Surfactin synthase thioesterase subunit [Lentzea flava]GGU22904.1 thioesterase [Lentzea flava]